MQLGMKQMQQQQQHSTAEIDREPSKIIIAVNCENGKVELESCVHEMHLKDDNNKP